MLPYHKYKHILISFWSKPNKIKGETRIKKGKINPKYFEQLTLGPEFKPFDAFYFSCGPSWYNWSTNNMWDSQRKGTEVYQIFINEDRLIKLNTVARIEKFMKEYQVKEFNDIYLIDWGKVAEKYAGFIACPFVKKELQQKYDKKNLNKIVWFLMLDCSSGCIWSMDGIKKCKKIGVFKDEDNTDEELRMMLDSVNQKSI